MKHNINISIDVYDEHLIKSVRHERVSSNDELELLSKFILIYFRIITDIRADEAFAAKINGRSNDDDIPF